VASLRLDYRLQAMRRLALALLPLAIWGCGSTSAPPSSGSPMERVWADQALVLLGGLDEALPRIETAGVGPATLTDASHLYVALLGYTYVDSCGEQLAHLGQPSARELEASNRLHKACAHLRHATALFTRAVKLKRTSLLVAAASEALSTKPLLHEARAVLSRIPQPRRPVP
jgi:hypothetical protein